MADIRQPIDWFRAISHGLFGLILGGLLGFCLWLRMPFLDWGIALVLVPALGLGLAGACWGNAFWEGVLEWWDDHGHWFGSSRK